MAKPTIPILTALREIRTGVALKPKAGLFIHWCPTTRKGDIFQGRVLYVDAGRGAFVQNHSFLTGLESDDVSWLTRDELAAAVIYASADAMRAAFDLIWPHYRPAAVPVTDFTPQQPLGTTPSVIPFSVIPEKK